MLHSCQICPLLSDLPKPQPTLVCRKTRLQSMMYKLQVRPSACSQLSTKQPLRPTEPQHRSQTLTDLSMHEGGGWVGGTIMMRKDCTPSQDNTVASTQMPTESWSHPKNSTTQAQHQQALDTPCSQTLNTQPAMLETLQKPLPKVTDALNLTKAGRRCTLHKG